jgi:hypothetical protein
MKIKMKMRFAGHETFACRASWLHKGLKYFKKEASLNSFSNPDAVVDLGVGKNMVLSIRFWLQAFGLVSEQGELLEDAILLTSIGERVAFDPLLEKKDSLWHLHILLVNNGYASIYTYFFKEFFKRKASRTFTESEFVRSINTWLKNLESSIPAERSMTSDLKVLIDSYCSRSIGKDPEESMMTLLVTLNLIIKTNYKSEGEQVYELNQAASTSISTTLFASLLIRAFSSPSESLDTLYDEIGYPLVLNREDFITRVENTCLEFPDMFVYKEDAGLREVQFNQGLDAVSFLASVKIEETC